MGERTSNEDRELALRVAAHVLEAMKHEGVSQNEIARRMKVTSGRLSRFMTGERVKVAPTFLVLLAKAIGSNPSRVLGTAPDARFLVEARRQAAGATPKRARRPLAAADQPSTSAAPSPRQSVERAETEGRVAPR